MGEGAGNDALLMPLFHLVPLHVVGMLVMKNQLKPPYF